MARKLPYFILKKLILGIVFTVSLIFGVFLLSPYIVHGVTGWINSKSGEAFVVGVIRTQARIQGYQVQGATVDIDLPHRISVQNLRLTDMAGQNVYLKSFEMLFSDGLQGALAMDAQVLSYDVSVNSNFALNGTSLALTRIRGTLPQVQISGNGSFHLATGAFNGALTGDVESLAPYGKFVGSDHVISPLHFDIKASSSIGWSEVSFGASTQNYTYLPLEYSLHNLSLSGRLKNAKRLELDELSFEDGKEGRAHLSGVFSLTSTDIDMRLKAQDFTSVVDDIADISLDADIVLDGRLNALHLGGDILLKHALVILPERFSNAPAELNIVEEPKSAEKNEVGQNVTLDLKLKAPNSVFVRGWGLDAEFGGALNVQGNAHVPELYGDFSILRGTFSEFGKEFSLPVARLSFSGAVPPSPSLDILAEHDAGDIVGKIGIAGTIAESDITLSAQPPLPEDEVLARILFGKSMDDLSPFQIVQLTQTLAKFSGAGGAASSFDPLDTVRQGIGLDELHVGMDDDGQVNVGAGKYIADGVYLELEGGSGEGNSGASVEIELTPNITLESEIGQDAHGGAGVFWEWDY